MSDPERAAPHLPDAPPTLADLVDVSDWLSRQAGIAHTPDHHLDWLNEQIAAVAVEPDLVRAARLADVDEHRSLFATRLEAVLADGWLPRQLAGVEVFERYDGDDAFRAQLNTAAGIAAYTAVRADPSLPVDEYLVEAVIPPKRRRQLVKAIEDHAPRYIHAGLAPARYIAEAHVPGGATSVEWDWIGYYLAAHPEVGHGAVLSPQQIEERNRRIADRFDRQAEDAFDAGDYRRALDLIDEAELHDPRREWNAAREYVHLHIAIQSYGGAAPEPGTAARTAFPQPSSQGQAGLAPAAGSPPDPPHPNRRSTRR